MSRYWVACATVALLLGGCAEHPPLSREESLALTTHIYPGVSKQQALDAAEKLFRLADGDRVSLVHYGDGFHAERMQAW